MTTRNALFLLAILTSIFYWLLHADILDLQKVSIKQQQDIARLSALVVHPKECAEGRI